MIEMPVWVLFTVAVGSFGVGFAVGRYLKPTISQQDGYCKIPPRGIAIAKLYADKKVADVTCVHIGAKGVCTLTNERCIYLS